MEKQLPTFFKNPETGKPMKPGTEAANFRVDLVTVNYTPTLTTRTNQKI